MKDHFYSLYDVEKVKDLTLQMQDVCDSDIINALNISGFSLERAAILFSNKAEKYLEQMAFKAREITRQKFGNIVNVFTPIYLSSYCINSCAYCGFNHSKKDFERVRLSISEAIAEARAVRDMGVSQILLVAGEDPRAINMQYLKEYISKIRGWFCCIGIEFHALSEDEYKELKKIGIDYVSFYQETYDPEGYAFYHRGPKSDFKRRIDNIDFVGRAKMSKIGMGFLLGLFQCEQDALSLAWHIDYVMRNYSFSQVNVSFPRIQASVSTKEYQSISRKLGVSLVTEKKLAQLMFATRLLFNDVGITLSTRESENFRNNMIPLVVTNTSAASRTSPGAYTSKNENLNQFMINDSRSLEGIRHMLHKKGLEAVIYQREFERL